MALQQKEEIVWWGGRDISYGDRRYWDERYQAQRDSCMGPAVHGATPCPQGTGGEEAAEGPGPGHVPGGGEQQGGGAPHAAVADPPEEFEFEWLCEYADVQPLLRFLLCPDDGGGGKTAAGSAGQGGGEERPGSGEGAAGEQGSPAATADSGAHSASPPPKESSMARLLASLRAGRAADAQRAQQAQQQRAQQQAQQQRPEAATETVAALHDRQLPCGDGGSAVIAASSAPATPIQVPLSVVDLGAGNSRLLHALCHELPGVVAFALDYSPFAFEAPMAQADAAGTAAASSGKGLGATSAAATGNNVVMGVVAERVAATVSEAALPTSSFVAAATPLAGADTRAGPAAARAAVVPQLQQNTRKGFTLSQVLQPEAVVADARHCLPFRPGSIGLVVDKGCIDAVLNDWDQYQLHQRWGRQGTEQQQQQQQQEGGRGEGGGGEGASREEEERRRAGVSAQEAEAVLSQVHRVLAVGGHYCVISYEPPRGRLWLLGPGAATAAGGDHGTAGEAGPAGAGAAASEPGVRAAAMGTGVGAGESVGGGPAESGGREGLLGSGLGCGRRGGDGLCRWDVLAAGWEHEETGNYVYLLRKA